MSIRRQIRLKREFLNKKHNEAQEAQRDVKKRKLSAALQSGTMIPTEIAADARKLHNEMDADVLDLDEKAAAAALDDEYAKVGQYEPKVCVTTSRDPSSRLKQFAKEVKLCIPNATAVNRGNTRTDELIDSCRKAGFSDVIILTETRGQPDGMTVSHLPFGPTAYFTLTNCVLRHDIPECKPASQAYPRIILDGLQSTVGTRVARVLQALYPIPKEESKRVITFANNNDFISFRHHMVVKKEGDVALEEAGPRFEMMPYEIRLGTADMKDAEKEWVYRPYMNTARKKTSL